MKPLSIPLEEFLRPFFDPSETVCLRIFDDRRGATAGNLPFRGDASLFKGAKLECAAGKIATMTDTLKNTMPRIAASILSSTTAGMRMRTSSESTLNSWSAIPSLLRSRRRRLKRSRCRRL